MNLRKAATENWWSVWWSFVFGWATNQWKNKSSSSVKFIFQVLKQCVVNRVCLLVLWLVGGTNSISSLFSSLDANSSLWCSWSSIWAFYYYYSHVDQQPLWVLHLITCKREWITWFTVKNRCGSEWRHVSDHKVTFLTGNRFLLLAPINTKRLHSK